MGTTTLLTRTASNRIPDKATFQRLSMANLLGNRFRQWDSVEDVERNHDGGVYIRGPVKQWPYMVPWCPVSALRKKVADIAAKTSVKGVTFVEVPPFGFPTRINGQAQRDHDFLTLEWGDDCSLSLRDDIALNGKCVTGVAAMDILRQRVPAEDVDMLFEIWEGYPDSIIEFRTYGKPVGIMNRHTIVFEVRNYIWWMVAAYAAHACAAFGSVLV